MHICFKYVMCPSSLDSGHQEPGSAVRQQHVHPNDQDWLLHVQHGGQADQLRPICYRTQAPQQETQSCKCSLCLYVDGVFLVCARVFVCA